MRSYTFCQWYDAIHIQNMDIKVLRLTSNSAKVEFPISFFKEKDFQSLNRQAPSLALTVGDVVIAKVEDVGGPLNNPTVTFKFKNDDKDAIATLPAKSLSPIERLALQEGAVVQVCISKIDGENIQVRLKSPASQSSTTNRVFQDTRKTEQRPNEKKTSNIKSNSSPIEKPSGTELRELKTGMALNGIIASTAPYAAFIDANIFRSGKGGTFIRVNGLLHGDDVSKKYGIVGGKGGKLPNGDSRLPLDVGTPVKVFVKEVWKNSGRFTLTMDPTIDKSKVIELKAKNKEEGQIRRRSRRIRRQLEAVAIGDMVSGWVDRIVPEGILVSIASLGPLNITGLIGTRDLPKQFTFPPDLKDSFKQQLLAQDFMTGRQISASVVKINPKYNPRMTYSMKLLFENFGNNIDKDDSNIQIPAFIEDEDDDEDQDEDIEVEEDPEVREVFDELRNGRTGVPVRDFRDWGDIQDMISSGEIRSQDLDEALSDAGALESDELSFQQFSEVIETLQDAMDSPSMKDNDEDEDDEDEDEEDIGQAAVSPVKVTKNSDKDSKKEVKKVEKVTETEIETETEDLDEDDEDDEELKQELFDELKGKSKTVSVKKFIAWDDVQDMLKDGDLDRAALDKGIKAVGADKSGELTFDQFSKLIDIFNNDGDDDEDDNKADMKIAPAKTNTAAITKNDKPLTTKVIEIDNDDNDSDDDIEQSDEMTEEEELALKKELFDQLRGKSKTVSVKKFIAWEDIQDMIKEGIIDKAIVNEAVKEVGADKSGELTFDQFSELVDKFNGEDETGEMTPEEELALQQELYDELRGKSKTLSIKKFMEWEDITDGLSEGYLSKDLIATAMKQAGINSKNTIDLTFEQFVFIVNKLNEDEEDGDGDAKNKQEEVVEEIKNKSTKDKKIDTIQSSTITTGTTTSKSPSPSSSSTTNFKGFGSTPIEDDDDDMVDMDDVDEMTEEEFIEFIRSDFDELRGKKEKVSVKKFKSWENVLELVDAELISMADIESKMKVMGVNNINGELNFSQFTTLMRMLDEAESQEEAAMRQEIFDELRGKKKTVSVKTFKAWDDVQDMLKENIIDMKTLDEAIKGVGAKNGELDFVQFISLMDVVTEYAQIAMNNEEEEVVVVKKDQEKVQLKQSQITAKDVSKSLQVEEEDEDEDIDLINKDTNNEGNEIQFQEYVLDVFNELKNKKNLVSVKKLKLWEGVKELLEEDVLNSEELDAVILSVSGSSSSTSTSSIELNLEQLTSVLRSIEEIVENFDEENEDDSIGDDDDIDDDDDGDDLTEEEFDEYCRSMFNDLKGKKNNMIPVKVLKNWDNVRELIDEGALQMDVLETTIKNMGISPMNGELDYNQFVRVVKMLDTVAADALSIDEDGDGDGNMTVIDDEEDVVDTTDGENDEEDEDDNRDTDTIKLDAFNEMKSTTGNTNTISLKRFRVWEDLTDMIKEGLVNMKQIEVKLKEIGGIKTGELTFEQFSTMVDYLVAIMENSANNDNDDSNDTTSTLPKASDVSKSIDDEEADKDFSSSLKTKPLLTQAGIGFSRPPIPTKAQIRTQQKLDAKMEYERKKANAAILAKQQIVVDNDNNDSNENTVATNDIQKKPINVIDELTKELYNDLRGSRSILPFKKFMEWDDLNEMINDGSLKRSSLAKALAKIGIEDGENITLDQFSKLMDVLKGSVDDADLAKGIDEEDDEEDTPILKSSKAGTVLQVEDDESGSDEDIYNDDGTMEEVDEEEAAKQVYDELSDGAKSLSLVRFLQWEDVQELLESGALDKDALATCIENAGVSVEEGQLTFNQFFDLINTIEDYIDFEKVPNNNDVVIEKKLTVNTPSQANSAINLVDEMLEDDEEVKISYIKNGVTSKGEEALDELQKDIDEDEDADEDDQLEVEEMFRDLCNGKKFVTLRELKKWDELDGLVEAGLVTRKTIETYIERLNLKDENKIDLETFSRFIAMMDTVLVDESGNLLGPEDADKA
eukprot:gene7472-15292_t